MSDDNILLMPLSRMKVPDDLTPAQAKIWRDVTSAKPVDWFDGASLHLLKSYCRVAVESSRIGQQIADFDDLATDKGLRRYAALGRVKASQDGILIALSRQLRLGQQQTIRPAKADTRRLTKRPWEQK